MLFPPQLSPVAQQMQPSQLSQSQHAVQAGGSCSGGASNRRRRTTELDPDERRQKFLERNRAAATRCRQKRKLWVSSLEKKAEELTHTNLQLQVRLTAGQALILQQHTENTQNLCVPPD